MSDLSAQESPPVLAERAGPVLKLWLNRPDRLNAVSTAMYQDLIALLEGVTSEGVRVVVLAGSGRAFCVGADLKAHREGRTDDERREYVLLGQKACLAIQQCPVPVVVAVNGYALGAGAEIALSADFVVMADDATMGFPELGLGTFFGGGVTSRIVSLVGLTKANELLFLGERFSGRQAAQWGLVYRGVKAEDLDAIVEELATRLAALAPVSVSFAKPIINEAHRLGIDEVTRREAEALSACMTTEDWAEGIRSFAEKRRPRFEGR